METQIFEEYRLRPSRPHLIALLEEAQGTALRVAYPVLRQRQDAEDVTQEVLLEFLDVLPGLADAAHARRWLYKAALHRAIDAKRSRRRRVERERRVGEQRAAEASAEALSEEDREEVHAQIAELAEPLQYVILGHFFEKRTLTTLARESGVSVTQMWKRLQQGKETLGERLSQAGYVAAVPTLGAYLGGLPIAEASPTLPESVLARVTTLKLGGASKLLATGGTIMVTKKFVGVSVLVIGLLCFALGVGVMHAIDTSSRNDDLSSRNSFDGSPSLLEAERDRALALAAKLQSRLDAMESEAQGRPVAKGETGKAEAGEIPPSFDGEGLEERLEHVVAWFKGQLDKMTKRRATLEQDESAALAFMDRYERGMLEVTSGLRNEIESDPQVFLDFLRAQTSPEAIHFLVDVLAERKRERVGEWYIYDRKYGDIPEALTDGMFSLLESSDPTLQLAGLGFASGVQQLPERHREQLGQLVSDPDPRVAAQALSSYHENIVTGPGSYPESMRRQVFDILDNASDAGLLSAATYALLSMEDQDAEICMLEQFERRPDPGLIHALSTVLTTKVQHVTPSLEPRYERALINALESDIAVTTFDSLVRSSLRLDSDRARNVLEVARRRAPSDRLAAAIDAVMVQMDDGVRSASMLERQLGSLTGEELGRPPRSSADGDPVPVGR